MRPSLLRRCLAGLGALLLALPVLGATQASSPSLPPVLVSLVKAGKLQVISRFDTPVPGLVGYIVKNKDGTELVYGEQGYLFVGHLISPKGVDLSDDYRDRFGPKPDYAAVVKKLDSAGHLISEGHGTAPLLYVFADPNCIFCYHFYRMAEPLVAAGRLRLRWVMVGFLQSSSTAKATAILAARDPLAALHTDEDRFNTAQESGGIAAAQSQDRGLQTLLTAHLTAMEAVGSQGTPTLLYRDAQGRWEPVIGLPTQDWLTRYATGKPLPANPNG